MAVDEPAGQQPKTVALDGALPMFLEWAQAEEDAATARARADKLKEQFRNTMATLGAGVGTVGGVKVITRKPTDTFRGRDLAQARPDMVEQYTRLVASPKFDLEQFKVEQPDLYAQYRAEQLRPDWKALKTAVSLMPQQSVAGG